MASTTNNFYQGLDTSGHLKRISKRFWKMKEITLKRYDNSVWFFVNDNSKCFNNDENRFDGSQSKFISLIFDEAMELRQIIDELQGYHLRMEVAIKQTLVTLRYLAKGDFFSETGDIHGISRSSVSRCVAEVVQAINNNMDNISFPTTDADIANQKRQFHRIAGLPNVVGAIDGTLIPIIAPSGDDEPAYICRKGYHAINVQAVAGPDLRFTDVVARWPGSQHDAGIFDRCGLKTFLEDNDCGWLVGDSGYPLKKCLITPKANPVLPEEVAFNEAHSRTRMVVERAFGVLKSRFRCLHKSAGVLPFTPEKSCQVTTACMRLHNFCMELGMPVPDPTEEDQGDHESAVFQDQGNNTANQIRQTLINNFR